MSFASYVDAVTATREIAQSGLGPANCRLLDPLESMLAAGRDRRRQPADPRLRVGRPPGGRGAGTGGGDLPRPRRRARRDADPWRGTFLRAPYLRDGLARLGVVVETFETACTWSRFDAPARGRARARSSPARGHLPVHPRLPGRAGALLHRLRRGPAAAPRWRSGTRSRRGSRQAYARQRRHDHPSPRGRPRPRPVVPAARAVRAPRCARSSRRLDPHGILNPGVLGL